MNAIIGKITPIMIADISYGTFFFYGACCVIMGLIVYVFLPETKGRSLEEMDEVSLFLILKYQNLNSLTIIDLPSWQSNCYRTKLW